MSLQYLPNVLVLTEECISTAHGTGTTLIRHFRNYPQEKLLNVYWMPKGEPVFQNHVYAQYSWVGGQPSKTSYDFSVVRFPSSVRQLIEETGFVPEVIYSTFFGWFGVKLLDLILQEYDYQLPVIQHFHDLQMPFDDLGPLEPELEAIAPHLTEIWALTSSIAEDVSAITKRDVQVVNTFCDVVPSIYKQEHRDFSSDFTAVITGNIWISDIIADLKAAWKWVDNTTGGIKPIQWYCHEGNMRENLEKYVFSDRNPVIEYAGFVRGNELYRVLADADIAIIPFNRNHDPENNYAKYSLPSRLTETVLAGLPAFVAAGSRTVTAQYVQEKGIGIAATASDPDHFRKTLLMFAQNRNLREQCGRQARALGLTEYNIERYEQFFYQKLAETTLKGTRRRLQTIQNFVPSTPEPLVSSAAKSATILICTPDVNSAITQRCIDSVRRYTTTPYELLVFENGKFGSFKHAREINRALEVRNGDVFVTLDDDVEVTPGWLEALLALAQPDVGVVGCVHYDAREGNKNNPIIDHAGGIVAIDGSTSHYKQPLAKPATAPFACSACILINDKSLRFDLDYNKYYQDVDLSLQAWEKGKKVVIAPHAIYHYISGQMEMLGYDYQGKLRILAQDLEIFREKWIHNNRLRNLEAAIQGQLDIPFSHNSFGSAAIFAAASQLPPQHNEQRNAGSFSTQSVYAPEQAVMSNNSTQQLLRQRLRQAQDALNGWNAMRMRQDETVRRSRILSRIRPLAFIYVFLARLRKLGKVWAADGRLYDAFLRLHADTIDALLKTGIASAPDQQTQALPDNAIAQFNDRTALLTTRLNELSLSVSNHQTQVLRQFDEIVAQLSEFRQSIDEAVAQLNEFRQSIDSIDQDVSQMRERVEHLEGLDESVRLSISYIRMLQQSAPPNDSINIPTTLRGSGIVDVIRRLEAEQPELQQANQVDVTIQSGGAEDEIALVASHLGERLSVMTPELWYYIDFDLDWHHPALFHSAQNKVKEGGKLVVITGSESEQELPTQNGSTSLVFEGKHTLPDMNVAAYIWRNQ